EHQRPERFKKHNIINAFKEEKKQKKNNHFDFIVKMKEIQKLAKADDKKELDSLISSRWDENLNEWVKDSKEEFTYDANENVNSFTTYNWDDNNLEWIPEDKYEFTFDSNRNISVLITSNWSTYSSQWSYVNKIYFTYDDNNLILESGFGFMITQWYATYKIEYAYDGNQNMISETYFQWWAQQRVWMNINKYELTYDMSGNLIEEFYFEWDFGSGEWGHATSKWDYEYDGGNNLISEVFSAWDGNDWVNEDKYDYTYLAGNMTTEIGWFWNSGWVEDYKDVYTFDANGNLTLGIYYYWYSNDWIPYEKEEFIYDLSYNSSDLIIPYIYMIYDYPNMLIGYRRYEFTDPTWKEVDKMILFFSDYNNALNIDDEILSSSVKLYPNPVDDVLTINSEIPLTKVEVYSILGKKVKEFKAGFNSMRIDNLSNGVYIVRILAEKGSATRKLIKK
ncbi:MAG: T9SS type A sorting domain-containing protein, partial [Aureibaculum sp.]